MRAEPPPRRRIRGVRAWILCLLMTPAALADSWSLDSGQRVFSGPGGLSVTATTDASRSTQSPEFSVSLSSDGRLLATHPGLWFSDVFFSADGESILGLSNRGIPGSAAGLFSRDGRLRFIANHAPRVMDYCTMSVTIVRHWFDAANPGVEFGPGNSADSITLNDCHGRRTDLRAATGGGRDLDP